MRDRTHTRARGGRTPSGCIPRRGVGWTLSARAARGGKTTMTQTGSQMAREKVVPIRTLGHFIDGALVAGASDRFGEVFNPATGAVAARVALASAEETRAAIHAARAALPTWAEVAPVQRAR